MRIALLLIIAGLTGCAAFSPPAFKVSVSHPEQPGMCLNLESRREFPNGFVASYDPETGLFKFGTDASRTDTSSYEAMLRAFETGASLGAKALIP